MQPGEVFDCPDLPQTPRELTFQTKLSTVVYKALLPVKLRINSSQLNSHFLRTPGFKSPLSFHLLVSFPFEKKNLPTSCYLSFILLSILRVSHVRGTVCLILFSIMVSPCIHLPTETSSVSFFMPPVIICSSFLHQVSLEWVTQSQVICSEQPLHVAHTAHPCESWEPGLLTFQGWRPHYS